MPDNGVFLTGPAAAGSCAPFPFPNEPLKRKYYGGITAKEETPHAEQAETQTELGLVRRHVGLLVARLEPGRLRRLGRSSRYAARPAGRHIDDHTHNRNNQPFDRFPGRSISLSDGNRDTLAHAARTDHQGQFQ